MKQGKERKGKWRIEFQKNSAIPFDRNESCGKPFFLYKAITVP